MSDQMPERVVFDTNIWISGLARKLRHPFGFTDNQVQAVLYQYRRISHRVDIPGTLHGVVVDPDDDIFIECAFVGEAKVIVSGDQHLLELGTYRDIVVLTADAFVSYAVKRG